jgi:hypothetical protein
METTSIILCVIIVLQQILHVRERKDLYNRIMAKDLQEYKQRPIKPRSVNCLIRKNNDSIKGGGNA